MTRGVGRQAGGFIWAALAATLASGCDVHIGSEAAGLTEVVKKEFKVSGIADLTLDTFDGSVEIRAWDRPDVFVDIEKRAGDREALDAIEIVAKQDGDRITVKAVRPPKRDVINIGFSVSPTAKVVASVPRHLDLTVSSGDGSISVERVNGRVDLQTGDGIIRGAELSGDLRASTGDGSIHLEAIQGKAEITTEDGGVWLAGSLELLRLRTGDGSVRIRIEKALPLAGDWDIKTLDGSLSVELPDGFNAELDARTGDGRVVVNWAGVSNEGRKDRRAFQATLGRGGPVVRLRTGDGTIRVSALHRGAGDR